MSLCNICEGLPPVKSCCDKSLCHLCANKHVCKVQPTTPSIDATVLIEELKRNYKKDNDTIYNLYDIVSKENIALKEEIASLEQKFDKLKQENSDLFDENTRLILEINQRKDNLQVDDDDVLKKKIIETTATTAPTVKKSNTLKRALPRKKRNKKIITRFLCCNSCSSSFDLSPKLSLM